MSSKNRITATLALLFLASSIPVKALNLQFPILNSDPITLPQPSTICDLSSSNSLLQLQSCLDKPQAPKNTPTPSPIPTPTPTPIPYSLNQHINTHSESTLSHTVLSKSTTQQSDNQGEVNQNFNSNESSSNQTHTSASSKSENPLNRLHSLILELGSKLLFPQL